MKQANTHAMYLLTAGLLPALLLLGGCVFLQQEVIVAEADTVEDNSDEVVVVADGEMATSHLGNEGPAFQEGMTPSRLGWGADDQAYPDRYVVYPDDGSEMVWVPPGSFPMGSTDEQVNYSVAVQGHAPWWVLDEQPARLVEMSGFWMGKHTVTNAQYHAFCEATGREFSERSHQGDDHPVVHVNWDDAVSYAEYYGFSLPTEAQWEYAARGPEGHIYPWGDEWDGSRLCWGQNRGPGGMSFPVGSFPEGASWCGALDMAGNVSEWCADWYDEYYYVSSPMKDPPGPSEGRAVPIRNGGYRFLGRVVRGGSWIHGLPRSLRTACRGCFIPTVRKPNRGFRCVRIP